MRFSRPLIALSISAIGIAALAAMLLVGANDTAQAQAPSCNEPPVEGNIPRCLIVIKQTLPNAAPGSFDINVTVDPPSGPNVDSSESLSDGDSFGIPLGSQETPAGTVITLTEDVPPGWELASAQCTGDGISTAATEDGIVVTYTGDLGPNDPFAFGVCTFTNRRETTPTVTATPATATTTPTVTGTPATATPTATATIFFPNVSNPPPGGLGAAVAPAPQATRTAVPQVSAPTASTVRPPSTGDGGLK
jgi:hypothetical protein